LRQSSAFFVKGFAVAPTQTQKDPVNPFLHAISSLKSRLARAASRRRPPAGLLQEMKRKHGIEFLGKNRHPATNKLYLFINRETQQKFILKELLKHDREVRVYAEHLPLIKVQFKSLVIPRPVAMFEAGEFAYILLPYYEGERFEFNTADLTLADDLVDIAVDLSTIEVAQVLKGKAAFNPEAFESSFWRYFEEAILLGLVNGKDKDRTKAECASILSSRFDEQKMIICNHDFNPRNVIRMRNGKLALIDWSNIVSPLEHLLAYPWLLNWQNPAWQKRYASNFEKKLPVNSHRLKMHLMNIALERAVEEKKNKNAFADIMAEDHMKKFRSVFCNFCSLTEF
jgi:hypothetical protein